MPPLQKTKDYYGIMVVHKPLIRHNKANKASFLGGVAFRGMPFNPKEGEMS